MPRLERDFKGQTLIEIREQNPGCVILPGDANAVQGIPDTIVIYHGRWAALEFKKNERAPRQPNQKYYVEMLNDWWFAAFIYPENKDDVLYELCKALRS